MKLIINNIDTYDIGHDDSVNEYLIYIMTSDGTIIKGLDKIYGENVLTDTVAIAKKTYSIEETIYVPYGKTTEESLNEIQD